MKKIITIKLVFLYIVNIMFIDYKKKKKKGIYKKILFLAILGILIN